LGRLLDLSDVGFGLWSGTSIGDTSSVVAIAYGFSEKAGDFATMVKLTRTLFIIPTVIAFTIISIKNKNLNSNRHGESDLEGARLKSVIPWFILGFVALAMINSLGFIPLSVSKTLKDISKFLMISALAAIGLSTNLGDLRKAGIEPLLHKLILSDIVILVSLMVIQFFGLN
ncbi:MAG: putative sulfate exporter family transporter, partial [Neofamilia sp.]